MFFFFKKTNNGPSILDKCPFFTAVFFSQLMAFLVGAALFFPSDLCAHTSERFHFRKQEDAGASRRTSKAAMQESVTVLRR